MRQKNSDEYENSDEKGSVNLKQISKLEFGGEIMSIVKHEIPILEFDTEQEAVINPTHEKLNIVLPRKCVFAFLGEYIDKYASKSEEEMHMNMHLPFALMQSWHIRVDKG